MIAEALASALGKPRNEKTIAEAGLKIRAAFAAGDDLAKETRLEVAGFLAEHPDPDAVLRALRRLWHTDIMLLRAVAEPLPAGAIGVLRPNLERLCARRCPLDTRKQTAATRRPISHRSYTRSQCSSAKCASGVNSGRCPSMMCCAS